jgi:hypothetical protein
LPWRGKERRAEHTLAVNEHQETILRLGLVALEVVPGVGFGGGHGLRLKGERGWWRGRRVGEEGRGTERVGERGERSGGELRDENAKSARRSGTCFFNDEGNEGQLFPLLERVDRQTHRVRRAEKQMQNQPLSILPPCRPPISFLAKLPTHFLGSLLPHQRR